MTSPDTCYAVAACNLSQASENKIHDDTVARRLGFTGGLVPGVEVYAYASHLAVRQWGRAWLEHGTMSIRFERPVYDGRIAIVSGCSADDGASLSLTVASDGARSATGVAACPRRDPAAGRHLEGLAVPPPPAAASRPAADEVSLAEGRLLATTGSVLTSGDIAEYAAAVREQHGLYSREGIAHPGQLLRLCNLVLRENVVLPPWIHTGSVVTNLGLARAGETIAARARVARNYDKKGHRLVDLDVLVTADGRPAVRVLHTAIYRLRAG